jgi:2-polyprenyl-3-methyl-5-hydroxy-6-metoxy-1,4-benzoquinol methylase
MAGHKQNMNIKEFYEKDSLKRFNHQVCPHDYDLFKLKELEKCDLADKKVLDIGAGSGFVLRKLLQRH